MLINKIIINPVSLLATAKGFVGMILNKRIRLIWIYGVKAGNSRVTEVSKLNKV